jgi:cyanophycinase
MTIAGAIALLGSGEFEPWTRELDRTLLEHATSGDGSVAIVPTASALEGTRFDEWAEKGLRHYSELGVPARLVDLRGRDDADRTDLIAAVEAASMIFFSGGNAAFLARTLAGSAFWDAVVARLHAGAVFAGCSAGACIAGSFAPQSMTESIWEEDWKRGLGILPDVWVLPHFDALDLHRPGIREYFLSRIPPTAWQLGIDERTAVVKTGESWAVFGEGTAFLGHGSSARRFAPGEIFSFDDVRLGSPARADLALEIEPLPPGAGPIVFLSSDQFSAGTIEIDRALIERCGPRVGVVTDGDPSHASTVEADAIRHYRSLGADPIRLRPDDTSDDVDVLFLAGGDPKELVPALEDSPLWRSSLARWRRGMGLAGSSAGAMALCERCLFADPGDDLPRHWGRGLGPVRSIAVAPHAATRPEEWLEDVVARSSASVIALDDGAALILEPRQAPTVMGDARIRALPAGSPSPPGTDGRASPIIRLFHRTASAQEIFRKGFLDSLENGSRDGAWEGSWFADEPLSTSDGPDGDTFLVLDVPRSVVEPFEWVDPEKPYREFILPRDVANELGPPRLLAADGTLRDSDPELLADAEPVWGRISPER